VLCRVCFKEQRTPAQQVQEHDARQGQTPVDASSAAQG
jgi:hypothetical protein